jgi:hypothetical protein
MRTQLASLGGLAASVAALLAGASTAHAAPYVANTNVARNAVATATVGGLPALPCTVRSGPENAVDGAASNIYTDKWCVPSGKPTLTITLPPSPSGYGYNVRQILIKHAQKAGESPTYNTRAYTLSATKLKRYWQPTPLGFLPVYLPNTNGVATVTGNINAVTIHDFFPDAALGTDVNLLNVTAVSLTVDVPTQGTNQATRIYEVEVWAHPAARAPGYPY